MMWWFGCAVWLLSGLGSAVLARGNGFSRLRALGYGVLGPVGFALAFRAASNLPRCPLDNSKVRCPDCKECAAGEPPIKDAPTG